MEPQITALERTMLARLRASGGCDGEAVKRIILQGVRFASPGAACPDAPSAFDDAGGNMFLRRLLAIGAFPATVAYSGSTPTTPSWHPPNLYPGFVGAVAVTQ
jgi:hypothetical protein